MGLTPSFWQGRRVFLTGHTGFKGAWLSLWLQQMGADLTGYALEPPTTPSLFDVAAVAQGMQSRLGDIRNLGNLTAALAASKAEVVIHMAAQALVRVAYAHPVDTFASNVMGTVNLLEAVRAAGTVRAVVIVTSDKCYDNREWPWGYRENEPMGGRDPYSSSKGCAELVTAAYRQSFFDPGEYAAHRVAVASARAGNVIGGGDWAQDRLVPDILRAIEQAKPVAIRNPQAIRPWQHVLEPLAGYLLLAEKLHAEGPRWGEGWNFGPADEDARPVQWIVEQLTGLWGAGATWQSDHQPHPHEAHHLRLDCSRARALLGWSPRWTLQVALEHIVAWHRAYHSGKNLRQLTLQQIAQYQSGGTVA